MKILSKQEIQLVIDRVAGLRAKTMLKIYTLIYTGIRVSELLRITPADILMGERQIIIRGKGKKIRNVNTPPQLLLPLSLYIKQKHIKPHEPIFPEQRANVYHLCKKYTGVNPHTFRHSYTVELLRKTKNIRYVQTQLGHADLRTTQIYLEHMEYDEENKKLTELWQ